MVSDVPAYVKYWRNKFTQKIEDINLNPVEQCHDTEAAFPNILAQYTTRLQVSPKERESVQTSIVDAKENNDTKQDFFFLSDVLPEEKVKYIFYKCSLFN